MRARLYAVAVTTPQTSRKASDAMKALSVRQPWAHMILCEEKPYEYRTWATDYRGDLLICSSANPKIKYTIAGHALCIVRLNDCIRVTSKNYKELGLDEKPDGKLYAWHLTDIRVVKPFAVKGKLSFYEVADELIEIIDNGDGSLTEEEAERRYKQYIEPLLYIGKE